MNLKLWLRWGFGLGIVAALLWRVDAPTVVRHLQSVSWQLAAPAIVGLTAMHLVGAATWRYLSSSITGLKVPWGRAVALYYAAQAAGSVTPSNVGADAYRVYALGNDARQWHLALVPVVIQRASSYIGLLLLGVLSTLFVPVPGGAWRLTTLLAGLLAVGAGVLWMMARVRFPEASRIGRLMSRLRRPWRQAVIPRTRLQGAVAMGVLLAILFHASCIALSYVLVMAVYGGPVPVAATIAAIVLARLAILIPISISGLGFQEGALAVLFPLVGIPAAAALTVSLLNRLALLVTICLGGALLVSRKARQTETSSKLAPAGEK